MTANEYDSENYRFWAMDPPASDRPAGAPLFGPGWDAVVDEEKGGIVLYCQDDLTNSVLAALRTAAGVEF